MDLRNLQTAYVTKRCARAHRTPGALGNSMTRRRWSDASAGTGFIGCGRGPRLGLDLRSVARLALLGHPEHRGVIAQVGGALLEAVDGGAFGLG
jgi:hypothetical protein